MPVRRVTWDTFDIWYTPRDHLFVEEHCVDGIAERFRERFGDANVHLHQFDSRIAGPYTALHEECVIVQHALTGRWCVWSTSDHVGYVFFTTMFRRLTDWTFYGAGFWNWKPASLLAAFLPSAHLPSWRAHLSGAGVEPMLEGLSLDEWLTPGRFPVCPYPGQNIDREEIDVVWAETRDLDRHPYLLFRGYVWTERTPFVRHLRDIATARRLTEVVLLSTKPNPDIPPEYHVPLNLESLPPFARESPHLLTMTPYLCELALATASLSLPGANDVSRRDQESLGVGTPLIRPAFTIDLWGLEDCRALIETHRCTDFACHEHFNWRVTSEDAVRQSCEEMIDEGLALIADRDRQREMRAAAREWYERYCDPGRVADYLASEMLARFEQALTSDTPRYEGVLIGSTGDA